MRIVGKILTGLFFIFGILFVIGSVNQPDPGGTFLTGIILLVICLVLGYFSFRKVRSADENAASVTLKIDMPGNVSMDAMKCKSCGGAISPKDVSLVAGAPVVTCPFCHSTYNLTEEPKW